MSVHGGIFGTPLVRSVLEAAVIFAGIDSSIQALTRGRVSFLNVIGRDDVNLRNGLEGAVILLTIALAVDDLTGNLLFGYDEDILAINSAIRGAPRAGETDGERAVSASPTPVTRARALLSGLTTGLRKTSRLAQVVVLAREFQKVHLRSLRRQRRERRERRQRVSEVSGMLSESGSARRGGLER